MGRLIRTVTTTAAATATALQMIRLREHHQAIGVKIVIRLIRWR